MTFIISLAIFIKLQTSNINELWSCMRAGDADALKELYNSLYQVLFTANFSICMRRDIVKDSIHDAFISIWVHRDKLPLVSSPGGYINTCVRRKMIDALRKEYPLESALLNTDTPYEFPYEEVVISFQEQEETRQTIREALTHLTGKQKEAIRLRFFENKNYEEIARLQGCEPRTIYNRVYEAVERLRQYFSVRHPR
ncbi:MAG: sigma-70 family RNA polymerase sigma factor [Sphingobacteriales bacterium]|nr:sigma-70 family RNA polymerase sigma factor [Sphingobacteriales bacterium]